MIFFLRSVCVTLLLALLAGVTAPATAQRVDWARQFQDGLAPTDGVAGQHAVDRDGNSYYTGYFQDSITFGGLTVRNATPGSLGYQTYLLKLDSTNRPVWLIRSATRALTGGSGGQTYGMALAYDTLGNLFMTGWGNGRLRFDNDSIALGDGHYLARFDGATGQCRWLRVLTRPTPGHPVQGFVQLAADNTGDCYLIGHCHQTDSVLNQPVIRRATFDPYLARVDANGRLRWLRQLQGPTINPTQSYPRIFCALAVDGAGNVAVAGAAGDSLTIAPGQVVNRDSVDGEPGGAEAILLKYDRSGNLLWFKQSRAAYTQAADYVTFDTHGNVLVQVASYFNNRLLHFDGHLVQGPSGLFKFSGAGMFQWVIDQGNGWLYSPIATDGDDNVYAAGSAGTALNCFHPDGTARWTTQYPNRPSWKFYAVSLQLDGARNAYIFGGADSVVTLGNIRLSGSYYGALARVSPRSNELTGRIFLDTDADGQLDAGEVGFPRFLPMQMIPGSDYQPRAGGWYSVFAGFGVYNYGIGQRPAHYTLTTPGRYAGTINSFGNVVTGRNFGFAAIANQPDLRVTFTAYTPARRGIPIRYQARVENVGTTTVPAGGTLVVTADARATIVGTVPATTPVGRTLTWTLPALAPFAVRTYDITLNLPLNVPLGAAVTTLAAVAAPAPTLDVEPNNNQDTLRQVVVGSYDPNDISVNHTLLTAGQIAAAVPLDYVVNFENMGTDTAFAVVITDSLPAGLLQLATIEVLSQSHNVRWSVSGPGLLTVSFPGIRLPHRAVDAVRAQGFVRFRIVPRTTLTPGTLIPNRAHIFFDFNSAVTTNDVLTLVQRPTGLAAQGAIGASMRLYPNPAQGRVTLEAAPGATATLLDVTGRVVRRAVLTDAPLTLDGLAPGLYVVRVAAPGGVETSRRLVVQ